MDSPQRFKKTERWSKASVKALELYEKFFKLHIEKKSHSKSPDVSIGNTSRILRPVATQRAIPKVFSNNHISLNKRNNIIELPKCRFGVHLAYNEETDFKSHFQQNSSKIIKQEIKLRKLVRKRLKHEKETKNNTRKYLKALEDYDVYNTSGGQLYCKSNKLLINAYNLEQNKFKHFNTIRIENKSAERGRSENKSYLKQDRTTRYATPL